MAETQSRPRLVRFGAFEADVQTGELRKDGVKLKFGGQPFQVLAILLERPGDVVMREELQKRLWPDTFVDVERNLNTAINKIREVLGDSAETPRFIETLSRRGYRFIGELEASVQPAVPAVAIEPDRASHRRPKWLKIGAGVLTLSVLGLAAFGVYRWHGRQQPPQEPTALNAVPFTALPGLETSAAFSPDGSRIAFAANGGKGFDLYVKAIGSETTLRLTQHPSDWLSPAWSPDGSQIAFHRFAGPDTGIYIVPTLGGPERKLRSTRVTQWENFTISWSPDGKWIALHDSLPEQGDGMIYLLSMQTLEAKQIPNGLNCMNQSQPAFSHSGKFLAFWCFRTLNELGMYSLDLASGQPRKIATFAGRPGGLTWSADDKELIYSVVDITKCGLGKVSIANGAITQLAFAGCAMLPALSPKGDKLAFTLVSDGLNIWRRDLLDPKSPAQELIASTRQQDNAQYSPDGKRIVFASDRSGILGVWVSDVDGSSLVQISNPHDVSGSPQWSPDGTKIAFDSRPVDLWEIQVVDLAEGNPRRLVTNVSSVYRPHWSRDGKWIYFRSDEVGKIGVYRCPSSGGDAIRLSNDLDGSSPQESFDGKTVYFASHGKTSDMRKEALPPQLGTDSEVEGLPRLRSSALWTLSPGGIYLVPGDAPRSVRYFDFATKQVRLVFEMNEDFGNALSVSTDGRWILYSQVEAPNSDIMLVDHFQ